MRPPGAPMRTLLEILREDEQHISRDVKVGGRYVCNDIAQAIAEIERQHQEIEYLRHYGNKDCTHMADEALIRDRKAGIKRLVDAT